MNNEDDYINDYVKITELGIKTIILIILLLIMINYGGDIYNFLSFDWLIK